MAKHIFSKEESCSTFYIANGRTPIFNTYLRVIWKILRKEEIPSITLGNEIPLVSHN